MRLTKKMILDLMADSESHGKQYYDDVQSGLSIYIGKKSATFYYQSWLPSGKRTRVKLGRFPALTVSQAREKAIGQARAINDGIDPNKERKLGRHGDSLCQITEDYIKTRKLKASTAHDYRQVIHLLGDAISNQNYRNFDEDQIIRIFLKITRERGEAPANKTGRVLRAVLGHTYAVREKRTYNPVQILTLKKMWHRIAPKKRVIPARSLGSYLLAIDFARKTADKRVTINICDYAEFTLITAFRLNESSRLAWGNVDLVNGTVFLEDPKNRVSILQPMPREAWNILKRRYTDRVSDWVFDGRPSNSGKIGPLNNPNKTLQAIAKLAGLEKITSHDLRRTATSIAESLGITDRRLKRMLNHSSGDVTGDYVSPYFDPESLRTSFQLVADFLYQKKAEAHQAGWKPAGVTS